jgi:ATP-binding cassette subfamily C protein CydD
MASGLSPLLIALAVAPASWVAALILLLTMVPFILGMIWPGRGGPQGTSPASGPHPPVRPVRGSSALPAHDPDLCGRSAYHPPPGRRLPGCRKAHHERAGIAFASSAILEFFAALSVALVAVYCGFSLLGLLPFPAPEP